MTGSVLATAEYGRPDGPPVVALHGGGGAKERWERTATRVAPQRRWICPDLRGFGASVKSPPWTLEQFAQDVVSTLDSLRVERADLIGASFGGTVAFAVVRLVPARVRSVVVLDAVVSTPEEYLSRRVAERTRTEMLQRSGRARAKTCRRNSGVRRSCPRPQAGSMLSPTRESCDASELGSDSTP